MSGVLVDGVTGVAVRDLDFPDGPATRVDLPLPAGHAILLLVLR
jgi:hypothetical protein